MHMSKTKHALIPHDGKNNKRHAAVEGKRSCFTLYASKQFRRQHAHAMR